MLRRMLRGTRPVMWHTAMWDQGMAPLHRCRGQSGARDSSLQFNDNLYVLL